MSDPEIDAMSSVASALSDLDEEAKGRCCGGRPIAMASRWGRTAVAVVLMI
jgi:hypothetical protein